MVNMFAKSGKKLLMRVAIGAAGAVMLLGTATVPAGAASRDGVCDPGEFCLYYLSNLQGSVSDFTTSIANYGSTQPGCYEFKGPGAGQGQCVKNNAMSAWNRRGAGVRVYYNSNYAGASDLVSANSSRNLSATSNNNASHQYI